MMARPGPLVQPGARELGSLDFATHMEEVRGNSPKEGFFYYSLGIGILSGQWQSIMEWEGAYRKMSDNEGGWAG